MKAIILIFKLVLIFSISTCFANVVDEQKELNTIYVPIVTHFANAQGSPPQRLSDSIIAAEVAQNKQFSKSKVHEMVKKGYFADTVDDDKFLDCKDELVKLKGKIDVAVYVDNYLKLWNLKTLTCNMYANITLIAYEFNRMNYEQDKPPLFYAASIVYSMPKTGDHGFVLVEGTSGTMYALDPSYKKMAILKNFPKLSNMSCYGRISLTHSVYLNFTLFRKPFYDVFYINYDTMWRLHAINTQNILNLVHTKNEHMKIFYETLRPNFPQWKYKYDDLFNKSLVTHTHGDNECEKDFSMPS